MLTAKAAALSSTSTLNDFNFGDNVHTWKKYLEVDEFVRTFSFVSW